jgi:hypothetical protein
VAAGSGDASVDERLSPAGSVAEPQALSIAAEATKSRPASSTK